MKIRRSILVLPIVSILAAGCGGGEPTVATLEVSPAALSLAPRQVATLSLSWQPTASLGEDAGAPIVFVHLLDDEGTVLRTFDHPFPKPWKPGTPVAYEIKLYQSALAQPLVAGTYPLTVGLYGQDGKRWPLEGAGEKVGRNEYQAATVKAEARGMGPRFGFSPHWLPTEPGTDRQVIARRWLTGAGAIRVSGLRGKGTVWLALLIPKPGPGDKLVYEPGATAPAVTINSSCGVEANVSGQGVHDVELPIEPPPSGDTCRLQVRANFHLEPQQGGPARAVSLENLAWIPAARQAG